MSGDENSGSLPMNNALKGGRGLEASQLGDPAALTAARIAYETYERTVPLPGRAPWEALDPSVRRAWLAAAFAVYDAHPSLRRPTAQDPCGETASIDADKCLLPKEHQGPHEWRDAEQILQDLAFDMHQASLTIGLLSQGQRRESAHICGEEDLRRQSIEFHAEIGRLRRALESIANDPHCSYDTRPASLSAADDQYSLGVCDGHRCAANKARDALKASTDCAPAATADPDPPCTECGHTLLAAWNGPHVKCSKAGEHWEERGRRVRLQNDEPVLVPARADSSPVLPGDEARVQKFFEDSLYEKESADELRALLAEVRNEERTMCLAIAHKERNYWLDRDADGNAACENIASLIRQRMAKAEPER